MRVTLALAAVVATCGLAACGPGATMGPSAPPSGWADAIVSERVAKDREFGSSPDSPLRTEDRFRFRALEYWPVDPQYRFAGSIEMLPRPEPVRIVTTTGEERPCEKIGRIRFTLHATPCALSVYRLLDTERRSGGEGLFLPFMDTTTGKATYPAGRYVELEGPEGGPFVLDFNRAYNPSCAYGAPERFQCPATPAENRLPVAVEAGERGWIKH